MDFIPLIYFPNASPAKFFFDILRWKIIFYNISDSPPCNDFGEKNSLKKWTKKWINRDFIKGGRGSSFYEVISQKSFFFHNWWLPLPKVTGRPDKDCSRWSQGLLDQATVSFSEEMSSSSPLRSSRGLFKLLLRHYSATIHLCWSISHT